MPLVCNVAGCKQAGRVFKNRAGLEAHKRFKHDGEGRGPFLETLLTSRQKIYDSLVGVDRQIVEKARLMGIDARTLGVEFIPEALQPYARGPVQHPEEEEDDEVRDAANNHGQGEPHHVESIMDTVARHMQEKQARGELPIRPLLPFRRSGS